MRKFWQRLGIGVALLLLAMVAVLAGCNRAEKEQEATAEATGEFAKTPADESSGWSAEEKDIATDEGMLTADELAESGENLPPNLTGEEKPEVGDVNEKGGGGEAANLGDSADAGFDGASVYKDFQCDKCHGESREGTVDGPPLLKVSKDWERPDLEQYLLDPVKTAEFDDRLQALKDQYKTEMPAWSGSGEELAALIDWLLLVPEEKEGE
jgi:hypothetical protein